MHVLFYKETSKANDDCWDWGKRRETLTEGEGGAECKRVEGRNSGNEGAEEDENEAADLDGERKFEHKSRYLSLLPISTTFVRHRDR